VIHGFTSFTISAWVKFENQGKTENILLDVANNPMDNEFFIGYYID